MGEIEEKVFDIIPLEIVHDCADLYNNRNKIILENVKVLKIFKRKHKYLKDFDLAEIFYEEEYDYEDYYNGLAEELKSEYDFSKLTGIRGRIRYVYLERLKFHEYSSPITKTKQELIDEYSARKEFYYEYNGLFGYARFDTPYQYVGFWDPSTQLNNLDEIYNEI